ncbi:MAG: redoxin domain-containing protein [Armatimonadota bacterium]
MAALQEGAKAPDFTLDGSGGKFALSDALKQHRFVILAFFPAAFSSVCTAEMTLYQEVQGEFARLGASIVGISVDSKYVQTEFAQKNNIQFPLLADFHPKGAVAQKYGVMRDDAGAAERALFIVDSGGVIRYGYVSEVGVNPGADRLLDRLEALQGSK